MWVSISTFHPFGSWLYSLDFLSVTFSFHQACSFFVCVQRLWESIVVDILKNVFWKTGWNDPGNYCWLPLNLCHNGHVYDKSAQVCSVCVCVWGCAFTYLGVNMCVLAVQPALMVLDIQSYGWGRCLYRTGLLMTNDFNVRLCYVAILTLPDVLSHMCHALDADQSLTLWLIQVMNKLFIICLSLNTDIGKSGIWC